LKLIRTEESFDGRKYTVYYTSETRIDYRKLVADLAPRLTEHFRALHSDLPVSLRYASDPEVVNEN
jgi:cell fate regulator YaaT (PSP1 superfamily)